MKTIFFCLCFILFSIVHAEPQPWGLIVKGSQCAKYWAGDECHSYKVPKGWTQLYGETIKYHGKECKFSIGDAKTCCKQLGLKFVELKLEKDLSISQTEFCKGR